ncbi:DUF2532 domain-containing protein [Rickettsia endosymbiont of Halotydeus destructor]|uniref:DUF2532 domain-containing protein n=1 Tax=Rickettsia endosymbiont of Halotydeus destructor TaxID=2996754 RepID=UPI003BAE3E34
MATRLLIIYFLLLYAVSANANINENKQQISQSSDKQAVIILPWSEDVDMFNSHSKEKLSFSSKQIEKEKKIHEKYYLTQSNPANFSTFFVEKPVSTVDLVISNFLKFCEDNYAAKYKTTSPNIQFKRQEEFLNEMKEQERKIYDKLHSRKK